jgi:hypothetical protein
MRGAVPPLHNTPSWRGAQLKASTGSALPLPLNRICLGMRPFGRMNEEVTEAVLTLSSCDVCFIEPAPVVSLCVSGGKPSCFILVCEEVHILFHLAV